MKNIILISTIILGIPFANGFSGVSYFGYSEDSGFELTRTYLTYKKEMSSELAFTFQTDVGQVGTDDRWDVYLKKAQLDWDLGNDRKISMGLIGNNMFSVQEKTWGNRFIAKSALDKAGWGISSADLGIGYSTQRRNLSVSWLITNGEGYKNSDVDDNQMLSLQVVYGEKRLDKNNGYNLGLVYSTLDNNDVITSEVTGFFGGWSNSSIRIYFEDYTLETTNSPDNELTAMGLNYIVLDNLSFFARQDTHNDTETLIAGFNWAPTAGLNICPNVTQVDNSDDEYKVNFQFKF